MPSTTNFPNGVSSFGIPIYGAQTNSAPLVGPVYFVDTVNGVDAGPGTGPSNPWQTLTYALQQASAGSTIFLMAGSTFTVSNASAYAVSTAGISIVGMGTGSTRPTFTLDTATTATIAVSAANVTFRNCIFTANFADIVSFFTLTTAANFTLDGNYFKATGANLNCLNVVDTSTTDNAADGLTLTGNTWIEPDTATLQMVKADADIDRLTVTGNRVQLGVKNNTPALLALATGKDATNMAMGYNNVFRLNTDTATGAILATTDTSANSGMIYGNFVQHADTAGELLITANAGWGTFQNFASGVVGASGYLLPAADS